MKQFKIRKGTNLDPVTVQDHEVEADTVLSAARQAYGLGYKEGELIDVLGEEGTWTYEVVDPNNVLELDFYPNERLVAVTVMVNVPVNRDVEEFLNEATFDATDEDGRDIYVRVDGYEPVEAE